MSKYRHNGRPLTHPDIAHLEAIIENNKRECAAIDRVLFRKPYYTARPATRAQLVPTIHDLAASNSLLRKLLRDIQR